MSTKIALLLGVSVFAGCTVDANIDPSELGATVYCVDTRDNTSFKFRASTVHEVRVGIGTGSSFKAVTEEGKTVYLNEDMTWLKCEKVLPLPPN